jgi:hypothetical protein
MGTAIMRRLFRALPGTTPSKSPFSRIYGWILSESVLLPVQEEEDGGGNGDDGGYRAKAR